jgi:RsiW-degrading membrane proteinase PrsW (M82 family)
MPTMSLPTQLLFMVGLPAAFAGLAYHSPPTAALIPILLSPTILAVWQYRRLPKEEAGHPEVAIWTYFGSSVLGPLTAGPLQLGLCSLMFKALFGAQASNYMRELQRLTLENVPAEVVEARKLMSWTPRYFLSLAIFSYIGAALVEEAIKYMALRLAVRRARPKHEQEYLIYAAVAGLGYGTIENILVTYASVAKEETGGMIALTMFERIIFASLGHTIMALLTGLQSIRRDARGEKLAFWQVLARAVAYHGTWDFILFSLSAWNGNVGWIHPTDIGSVVFALSSVIALQIRAAWDVSKQLKELQLKACK